VCVDVNGMLFVEFVCDAFFSLSVLLLLLLLFGFYSASVLLIRSLRCRLFARGRAGDDSA
jgi:hypothetical protein